MGSKTSSFENHNVHALVVTGFDEVMLGVMSKPEAYYKKL